MISIPVAVEAIIKKRPFLEAALVEGLVNLSALARHIKPEIEKMVGKEVHDSAVIMALNRLVTHLESFTAEKAKGIVENIGDITVRSNLADYTFLNSPTLLHTHAQLLEKINQMNNIFCTFSRGIYETTLVVSESLIALVEEAFAGEQVISKNTNLSLITVKLPSDNTLYPGVYYYLFKELAWDNINIVEVISTTNEFTIVVSDKDIHRAFAVLMNAKQRGASVEKM
jgi:aspartokinase